MPSDVCVNKIKILSCIIIDACRYIKWWIQSVDWINKKLLKFIYKYNILKCRFMLEENKKGFKIKVTNMRKWNEFLLDIPPTIFYIFVCIKLDCFCVV